MNEFRYFTEDAYPNIIWRVRGDGHVEVRDTTEDKWSPSVCRATDFAGEIPAREGELA